MRQGLPFNGAPSNATHVINKIERTQLTESRNGRIFSKFSHCVLAVALTAAAASLHLLGTFLAFVALGGDPALNVAPTS